jgi:hypothetical protein
MAETYYYHVHRKNAEAMLLAAMLGAAPRVLANIGGSLKSLSYGNYFVYNSLWLVVRISRIPRPFWGLGYGCVERFADERFGLVLLVAPQRGWLLSKEQVLKRTRARRWPISKKLEYKIAGPPPEADLFESVDELRVLLSRF